MAVYREADPEDKQHRALNNSPNPIEVVSVQLKKKDSTAPHTVELSVELDCPESDELTEFKNSLSLKKETLPSFAEWKSSFMHTLTQVIALLESEKLSSARFLIEVGDPFEKKESKE